MAQDGDKLIVAGEGASLGSIRVEFAASMWLYLPSREQPHTLVVQTEDEAAADFHWLHREELRQRAGVSAVEIRLQTDRYEACLRYEPQP